MKVLERVIEERVRKIVKTDSMQFGSFFIFRQLQDKYLARNKKLIIIIILMNFYSPVSNTRCHSIGHKTRIARIKIRVDSQGRWERAYGENAILKRCVLSLERNIRREDEFRVSGGSEFQSRGPMTEKALLPSDDLTYGMERTSESEDRVETECDGNERLL